MENLDLIFRKIKSILENHSSNLKATEEIKDSKAKISKPGYHLYGSKDVSLFGKKPQPTYIAGVIKQKNYVSFYLSPIYSHPELIQNVNPFLKKFLKGKSCFNINKTTPQLYDEIDNILTIGIQKYIDIEWI
ncbi:MAG: hypothetical protein ACXAC7_01930 [Candidatus Hodarchaeales archaeon]